MTSPNTTGALITTTCCRRLALWAGTIEAAGRPWGALLLSSLPFLFAFRAASILSVVDPNLMLGCLQSGRTLLR